MSILYPLTDPAVQFALFAVVFALFSCWLSIYYLPKNSSNIKKRKKKR